jgi:tRNA(adenine34) deaminase
MHKTKDHLDFMSIALKEAQLAFSQGEVPVGAAAVLDGECIAHAHNKVLKLNDPTAHAEIVLLRKVSNLVSNYRLKEIDIYVTLEPCPMCVSAAVQSRIRSLYFGATSEKWGYMTRFNMDLSIWNHKIKVYSGMMDKEAETLLKEFFENRR